ncbi:MAG: hypothetical protein GXP35_12945 [Actinobacteria bacterium]|nr:hypothetical protein [Actinomycetota bacterium]
MADRPNDWADFPVGQVIDELVGSESEVPDLIDELVTDCLAGRGVGPSIAAGYEAQPSAAPSPAQVLGVASGFGSIAKQFEPLPSALPGARPSRLEVALGGENGQLGCTQLVQERADNPVARVLDVLGSDLATLKLGYQTDEHVRTFWQSWAACMNDQGYKAANLEILRDRFTADAHEVLSASKPDLTNQSGVLGIVLPEEEQQKILDDAAEETKNALDRLRSREESAASASSQCGADPSRSIPQTLTSLRIGYEQSMLDVTRDKIESLLAEIATFVSDNSDPGR